jgi:putative transcriptional regulator
MQKNRVKDLRAEQGLTQKQLAASVGTSQQQIQRIESGLQTVRFDLAMRICEALKAKAADVFPEVKVPLMDALKRGVESPYKDERLVGQLENCGFDMAREHWSFKYRLRGGLDGCLPISDAERDKLWEATQANEQESFLVFDSAGRRYAINRTHLMFWQFCFDVSASFHPDEQEEAPTICVTFSDGSRCEFLSLPDGQAKDEEEIEDEELKDLFLHANAGRKILSFLDGDGERVFLQSKDVCLFSAPLIDLYPNISEDKAPSQRQKGKGNKA